MKASIWCITFIGWCSTVFTALRRSESAGTTQAPVGASLLANAIDQSILMLNDTPLSRAGSPPQVLCHNLSLMEHSESWPIMNLIT
ncbi:hypothetical protein FQ185_26070 [Pseudomonas sp. ANT_H12B]|nr:hypothetical protein FQ185_26070 [Pseudomonas sp. ANT_H12B]